MARTEISICSRALMNLGAAPLNSFTDPGDVPQFLKLAYPEIRANIMSNYKWECMKEVKEASRISGSVVGYRYSFIMPPECVGAPSAVYWTDQPYTPATAGYEVRGRRIVSNWERLWVEYSVEKPESEWPAWFVELVVGAICAEIAFMVTDQQSVKDYWDVKTYGTPSEQRVGGLMGNAMTLDAQGSGNNPGIGSNAFVDARFGAVYPGDSW